MTALASSIVPERTPPVLHFSEVAASAVDYFDLQPAALLDFTETFTSDVGQYTTFSEGSAGTFAFTGGNGRIDNGAASQSTYVRQGPDLTVPQAAVAIDIVSRSASGSPAYDNVSIGIAKDANNFIFAQLDRIAGEFRFQIKIGGSNNFHAGVAGSLPNKLGFSLVGNSVALWKDTGAGWALVTTFNITSRIDFKAATLTGWKACFGVASPDTVQWNFDNFKGGRFGAVGLRDLCAVTAEDGTPALSGSVLTATATAAGASGDVDSSYMGVFTIDLVAHTASQVGVIMVSRSGKIQNDHAGQIIWNGADSRLLISTWGNGFSSTLEVLHKLETGVDLRSGVHVVSGTSTLALPELSGSGGSGRYDPFAQKKGGVWYIGYTAVIDTSFAGSPFYAALASSSDLASFTAIGADSSHHGYEGSKLLDADDRLFLLQGGHTTVRAYSASGAFVATVDVTTDGGTDTYPHPMIVPRGKEQILLTFDKSRLGGGGGPAFSWGDVRFYSAPRYK